MPVWFIFHVENAVVLVWQVSHGAVVGMCVVGLPSAWVPLWQLAHPDVIPVWSNVAFLNDVVLLWQFSHGSDVGMWLDGLLITSLNAPP